MKKSLTIFPLFLFLINFFTKFIYLTNQEIGLDEPFSIYHAQFAISDIIAQLKAYNNPPLFEILLHYWIKFFGISPLSVRMLPMLLASVTPVVLYFFARKYFSVTVAVISSLIVSFSSLLVYYSHDCRVYSLFVLLSILSMYFYLDLIKNKIKVSFVLHTVFSTLLIYAHYFGIFVLVIQFLHLILFERKSFLKVFLGFACVGLLYLPHVIVLFQRLRYSVGHGTWLKAPAGLESLYNMLWSFSNEPLVVIMCLIVLISGLMFSAKKGLFVNTDRILVGLWFLVPFLGMFFISYKVPMFIDRYLIFLLPAYYLQIAFSLESLFSNKKVQYLVAGILISGFIFTLKLNPDKKQFVKELAEEVEHQKTDRTLVLVTPFDLLPAFAYHYSLPDFKAISDGNEYRMTDSLLRRDNVFLIYNRKHLHQIMFSDYDKVLYARSGQEDYESDWKGILEELKTVFTLEEEKKIKGNCSVFVLRREAHH